MLHFSSGYVFLGVNEIPVEYDLAFDRNHIEIKKKKENKEEKQPLK